MAERPLISNPNKTFAWETLTASDTGEPLTTSRGPIISTVQATGTFGGTVSLQGTINGTDWFTLEDKNGDAIEFTAAGAAEFSSAVRKVRPIAGSGVSDVDVFLAVSA
jgi:hypothetical protein